MLREHQQVATSNATAGNVYVGKKQRSSRSG